MFKVYDTRIAIHADAKNDTLDKLDEMLNQYGVDHCFTLPSNHEIDEAEANGKPIELSLFYCSEQNVELTLIVNLYARLYRRRDRQEIVESIVKSFGSAK